MKKFEITAIEDKDFVIITVMEKDEGYTTYRNAMLVEKDVLEKLIRYYRAARYEVYPVTFAGKDYELYIIPNWYFNDKYILVEKGAHNG